MKQETFVADNKEWTVAIGRNREDNWQIIDSSEATDIWFHVSNEASCHVVLKTTVKIGDIPKQVIKRCAYLCKINSKAKTSKTKVSIVYTQIKNVEKVDHVGQVYTSSTKTVTV